MLNGALADILAALKYFLGTLFSRPEDVKQNSMNQEPTPIKQTPADEIVAVATSFLGKNPAPNDGVPNEVACVDHLCKILDMTSHGLHMKLTFTPYLFNALRISPLWRAVLTPSPGCIIVSPTTPFAEGHCGIFLTNNRIASNNSDTGLWQDNYSINAWINSFRLLKGLKVFIFEPI